MARRLLPPAASSGPAPSARRFTATPAPSPSASGALDRAGSGHGWGRVRAGRGQGEGNVRRTCRETHVFVARRLPRSVRPPPFLCFQFAHTHTGCGTERSLWWWTQLQGRRLRPVAKSLARSSTRPAGPHTTRARSAATRRAATPTPTPTTRTGRATAVPQPAATSRPASPLCPSVSQRSPTVDHQCGMPQTGSARAVAGVEAAGRE